MSKPQQALQPGRKFIIFSAYLYIVLGILFVVNPSGMAGGLGYENLDKSAMTEVMATYGGSWVGVGVFIIYLLKNGLLKESLMVIALTFLGFFGGRILGIIRFQGFYGLNCYYAIFELVYLIITKKYLDKYKTGVQPT